MFSSSDSFEQVVSMIFNLSVEPLLVIVKRMIELNELVSLHLQSLQSSWVSVSIKLSAVLFVLRCRLLNMKSRRRQMRTRFSCSWKKVAEDDADKADIHKILRMMTMMLTKFVC